MRRVITPGETEIDVDWMPYPLAQAATCAVQTGDGVKLCVLGGMSPLAQGALMVAAGIEASIVRETGATPEEVADRAAKVAFAVLQKIEPLDTAIRIKQQEVANDDRKKLIEEN